MLDVFIIEEIRRREQEMERRQDERRPRKELPLPNPPSRRERDEEPTPDRGVVIIDYSIDGTIDGYGWGT